MTDEALMSEFGTMLEAQKSAIASQLEDQTKSLAERLSALEERARRRPGKPASGYGDGTRTAGPGARLSEKVRETPSSRR
jgi:hypothetical protein